MRFLVALAACAALVSACSSDDDDGNGGGTNADGDTVACSITPTAEVRSTLQQPGIGEPATTKVSSLTECAYPEGENTLKVTIRYHLGVDDEYWATLKKGFVDSKQEMTPQAGLGDEAFSSTFAAAGITVNGLVARKGNRAVQLTSSATIDQSRTLVASILTRF